MKLREKSFDVPTLLPKVFLVWTNLKFQEWIIGPFEYTPGSACTGTGFRNIFGLQNIVLYTESQSTN